MFSCVEGRSRALASSERVKVGMAELYCDTAKSRPEEKDAPGKLRATLRLNQIPMTTPISLSPAALLAPLHWRYATKAFDPAKKIAPELWKALEETLVLSPSSYGLQPWKFIVITDPELRARL